MIKPALQRPLALPVLPAVRLAALLFALLALSACASKPCPPTTGQPWHLDTARLWTLYRAAIIDARTANADEISTSLLAITRPADDPRMEWDSDAADANRQPRVLVASLMSPETAARFVPGATTTATDELTWVTIPYNLSDHAAAFAPCADSLQLRIRMLQLLGLPPNDGSDRIAFFYVRPQDLRRPTPDPEIDDRTASLHFPADAPQHYRTWFAANADFSYNSPTPYPWTRLGYTYDWHYADAESADGSTKTDASTDGNTAETADRSTKTDASTRISGSPVQGPSEFIVHPGAPMQVLRVTGVWTWYRQLHH